MHHYLTAHLTNTVFFCDSVGFHRKASFDGGVENELRLHFFHRPVPENNQGVFQCPAAGGQPCGHH